MKTGFARRCITPPVGTHMMGYGNRTDGCLGVYDDLYVSAIALADDTGAPPVVITSFDLSAFGRRQVELLFDGCRDRIDRDRLLVATIHTHAGPVVADRPTLPPEDEYLGALIATTNEAIGAAMDDLVPARLSVGEAPVVLGANRRIVADGQVSMGVNRDGPSLPVMTTWTFERDGADDLLVFSTAMHPVTMGPDNLYISAEWPGVARRDLQRVLSGTQAVYLQGCAGDQNCWRERRDYSQVVDNGRTAAEAALAAHAGRRVVETTPMRSLARVCELPTVSGGTWPVPLFGLRLGEALLTTICGEPVVEYALYQRANSPAASILPLGYSQGSEGYVATAQIYAEGGYEATANRQFPVGEPFAPACEETLKRALSALTSELYA